MWSQITSVMLCTTKISPINKNYTIQKLINYRIPSHTLIAQVSCHSDVVCVIYLVYQPSTHMRQEILLISDLLLFRWWGKYGIRNCNEELFTLQFHCGISTASSSISTT